MANEIKTSKWQIFLSVLWLFSCFSGHFWVCEANQANPQNPGFGLVFQAPTDYALASQRFNFAVDTSYRIGKLAEGNPDGLYVKYFSLSQISKTKRRKICPNYDYIVSNHPEWILRKTDGSFFPGFQPGYLMDIGNQSYVNYAINFIKNTAFRILEGHCLDFHWTMGSLDMHLIRTRNIQRLPGRMHGKT